MELIGFVGQPCKSRLAFEFVPKRQKELDLEKEASLLHERGVFIELETPYLLMLKIGGKNVSLFRSGKIIVKETKDEDKAREIAEKLIEKMK